MTDPTSLPPARSEPPRPRRPRWLAWGIGIVVGIVALLGAAVLALQHPRVATGFVNAALARLPALARANLTVTQVRGNWVSGLELTGFRMMRGDTVLVAADTVRVRYRIASLMAGRLDAEDLDLAGLVITADLIDTTRREPAKPRAPLTLADLLRGRFYPGPSFGIDRLAIRRARYGGRYGAPDSSVFLTDVGLHARGIRLGREFAFQIDSLVAHRRPASGGGAIEVALSAALADGRFTAPTIRFHTDSSAVDGEVVMGVDRGDTLVDARIVLHVPQFHLRDLESFAPGLPLDGVVTAAIDLRGAHANRLSGIADVTADHAVWGDLSFDDLRLDARFADGRADARLTARFQDAPARVTGWIRPLDRAPSYHLTVTAERLPARLPGLTWWTGIATRFGGGAQLQVRGTGYARPAADLTGRFEGEAGALAIEARVDLPNDLAWELRRLTFTDLDLARLIGDTLASSLSGTLEGSGRTPARGGSRLGAVLMLAPSHYGTREVANARARFSMIGEAIGGSLQVVAAGGTFSVDSLAGHWNRDGVFQLRNARFERVDLAALTGNPALASALSGHISGTARGVTALAGPRGGAVALREGRTRGELRVALARSTFRAATIDGGALAVRLQGGRVELDGGLDSPSGQVALAGSARPFDARTEWTLTSARFSELDLAAWTGSPSLSSRLAGLLTGFGNLASPDRSTTWRGELRLDRSRIAGLDLSGGNVTAGGSADAATRLRADLRSGADTLRAQFVMESGPTEPEGRGEVTVPIRWIAGLLRRDSLASAGRMTAEASFRGTAPATMQAEGRLTGAGALGAARLDSLFAGFRLRDGIVTLDTMLVRSNAGAAAGAGQIALFDSTAASDLRATLRVTDARPLRALIGADTMSVDTTTLAVRVRGARGRRTVRVEGLMRSLVWNGIRLQRAEGTVESQLDASWRPVRTRIDAGVRRLRGVGIPVNEARGRVVVDGGITTFDVTGNRDERHRLHAVGSSREDSAGRHVELATLDVVSDSASWALAKPAHFDLGRDRFEVRDFQLRSTGGSLEARGVIDRRGEQDFLLSMHNVGLDILSVWVGREGLTGVLNGELRVEGPARTPRGSGHLETALRVEGQPAGMVSSAARWNGTRVDFDGRFASPAGDSIAWSGDLPLALSLAATDSGASTRLKVLEGDVDVRVRARQFPLAALSPVLDPRTVGTLDGTLDLDVRLRGSSRAVTGTGRIDVARGVLPLPGLGVIYRDLEFHGAFEKDRLVVNRAHATSSKGTLDASGDVRFVGVNRIEPRLRADLKKFVFVETQDLRAVASGALEVSGTVTSPVVKGKATIENSNFYLVQSDLQDPNSTVRLTDGDLRMLEETFGDVSAAPPNLALSLYDASTLDLAVTLERNNWVRQRVRPKMSVALTGDFKLQKAPHGEPLLFGKIAPIPGRGYVEQFARSFDVTGGDILLNGPMNRHRVDLQAQYKPPSHSESDEDETVVKLDVDGTLDKLSLVLSSEPPMSEVEIIDFIATGRTRTDPASAASDAKLAKDIGLSQVTGLAEERAQEAIGLDVLQVRFDALQGATLVAGRYIDSQLYVGFRQPLQYKDTSASSNSDVTTSTSVEVEYAIRQWLVLNLQGETSKVRSFFRVRHAY